MPLAARNAADTDAVVLGLVRQPLLCHVDDGNAVSGRNESAAQQLDLIADAAAADLRGIIQSIKTDVQCTSSVMRDLE